MVKLSVIVPVYNVELFLDQCVQSIVSQTFRNLELILVDDGSSDNSGKICDKWRMLDKRIIVIHKENSGQLAARNSGVAIARGKYIAFIDSDDYIGINLFSDLFKIIEKYKPEVLAYGYRRITEGGVYIDTINNHCSTGFYEHYSVNKVIEKLVSDTEVKHYNMGSVIYGVAAKIFCKNFYINCVPNISNDIVNGEDMAVTMKCVTQCKTIYISDVSEYYYRQREYSMLHTFRAND